MAGISMLWSFEEVVSPGRYLAELRETRPFLSLNPGNKKRGGNRPFFYVQ